MASSSGNSITSSQNQNSGSEGNNLKRVTNTDEKKRKRMQSNRESARRSRMRKQKHGDDLKSQVDKLRNDNHQILQTINLTSQQYLNFEAENSILRAQMSELTQRLQSLNDMINYRNTLSGFNSFEVDSLGFGASGLLDFGIFNGYNDIWTMGYLNQHPIMAHADVLHC